MLAGERKLFAMRIFSGILAALAIAAAGTAYAASGVKYASPQAAFEQGLGAYKSGYYEIAVPALEEAAAKGPELNRFFAQFYLARIYSDNAGALTNHAKAYLLFQKLAEENVDADPDDGRRAPFVAKALTALAGYLRRGVREIGVRPDAERANEYLQHAATFFGDKDARFELAKHYLSRGGEDVKRGMHYLSVLSEEAFPSAQAFLADLFWRGKYVKKDEQRALALITMAVENAPEHERIWIEDIYQNVFCGSSLGTRKQADGIVATWRKIFARPASNGEQGGPALQPQRTCGNGEVVDIQRYQPAGAKERAPPVAATPPAARPEVMQGGAASFGLRDAGTTK
jgi:exopolysaccharide production negative regulator